MHPEISLPNHDALSTEYVVRRKTVEMSPFGQDDDIAAAGAAQARQHNVLIGIEVNTEAGGDDRVDLFVAEALIKLHASTATAPY